jgi:hypothetical protein
VVGVAADGAAVAGTSVGDCGVIGVAAGACVATTAGTTVARGGVAATAGAQAESNTLTAIKTETNK